MSCATPADTYRNNGRSRNSLRDQPIILIIQLLALFLAIVPHEVAHGYVAWKLGDPTARQANRLTLNPLAHIDLFGSIILPAMLFLMHSPVLFGWAKPVPFNPRYFRDPRRGIMLVGAAGPLANFALAIFSALLIRLIGAAGGILTTFLAYLCITNVILGVFNLIPIPPLDGSRVAMGFLPDDWVQLYQRIEPFGIFIIFGLLWLDALDWVFKLAEFLMFGLLLGG
ncbi:MAG: site-2 protease family protein [Lentisphaerae bacterium]|nr:site-2 protease family protein [Lentisphaerota bacterium]